MEDREQYVRYQRDRAVLAAIGARLDTQVGRISVRLPRCVPCSELTASASGRPRSSL